MWKQMIFVICMAGGTVLGIFAALVLGVEQQKLLTALLFLLGICLTAECCLEWRRAKMKKGKNEEG